MGVLLRLLITASFVQMVGSRLSTTCLKRSAFVAIDIAPATYPHPALPLCAAQAPGTTFRLAPRQWSAMGMTLRGGSGYFGGFGSGTRVQGLIAASVGSARKAWPGAAASWMESRTRNPGPLTSPRMRGGGNDENDGQKYSGKSGSARRDKKVGAQREKKPPRPLTPEEIEQVRRCAALTIPHPRSFISPS